MERSLLDVLAPEAAEGRVFRMEPVRITGVAVGIVTNNRDPKKLGRVRVRFPWLPGLEQGNESQWARVAVPMAGRRRGVYFLPEVDDEVLVAFGHGDVGSPYVVGALWNGEDPPPVTNEDGTNDVREIRSRSGHTIRLDDSRGGEKIEIVDASGKNRIVIDTSRRSVTLTADGDLAISAPAGKVTIAGKSVEIAASQDVTVDGAATARVEGRTQLTLTGGLVDIN